MRRSLEDGHTVSAVVRNAQQRTELLHRHSDRLQVHVADLADRAAVRNFVDGAKGTAFDTILLNAGCAKVGRFHRLAEQTIDDIIETNLLTNMRIVHGMMPAIQAHGTKIVFVSSIVARMPGREYASYAVSKAGLSQFYNAVSLEYPDLPLLCVEIGPVDTPFHDKANLKIEKKSMFKPQELIGNRLYEAMLTRTGITTLAADWALVRKAAMVFEDAIVALQRWRRRRSETEITTGD